MRSSKNRVVPGNARSPRQSQAGALRSNSATPSRPRKKADGSGRSKKLESNNLVTILCSDIEERARILNYDEEDGNNDNAEPEAVSKMKRRKLFCTSFWLNFGVLLLAGPLFLTLFCNDACEYSSPNIVCPVVNTTNPQQNYNCLNHPGECQCADSSLKGDNKCDPFNNNCGCDWDGGDCCTHDFDTTFCNLDQSLCKCLDPWAPKLCALGSCNNAIAGNGQCDGHNNNCNCNWDGGDCCQQNYTCGKNCRIVDQNPYNLTIDSFSTCDYIGTVHIRGNSYCQELESNFGCDCAGCRCDVSETVGTGCSGSGCHCKDPTSEAFFAHNDAEQFTTYVPLNYEPPARPDNATQGWNLEDVCDYIDFEEYPWDDSCTCPCRVSVRWYVNVAWVIVFGIVYFVYLLEALLMHSLLVKSACRHSFLGQKMMTHFSSETLRFVRRVKGSKGPGVAVQQFRDAPPVFLMRMDTYQSRQRYKAGLKPKRTAAARMRMTFWRDETQDVVGLAGKRHAKLWLKKTLCFDGYSTATFFEKRRKAFISKHATPGKDFQCYSEELVVPDFKDYGIWSKPRNILIGSLPYLICTFGGVSWFYRMFVECATSPFEVEVFKMVSNNDHTKRLANKSKRWRLPPTELQLRTGIKEVPTKIHSHKFEHML